MAGHLLQAQPSRWVSRFAPLVPAGRVLDLACGGGRHARLFASLGHPVLAVDRDPAALLASAAERMVWAYCSARGVSHSPTITAAIMNSAPTFITDKMMRASETPAARITINSLLLASVPRPTMLPISATGGKSW